MFDLANDSGQHKYYSLIQTIRKVTWLQPDQSSAFSQEQPGIKLLSYHPDLRSPLMVFIIVSNMSLLN